MDKKVHRSVQAMIGEYDELLNLIKKWITKVFCFSKGDYTEQGERKKKTEADRGRGGKTI